jgi:hypothetical protein
VPSNFEVISLIAAADIELDPVGKSSIVIAT